MASPVSIVILPKKEDVVVISSDILSKSMSNQSQLNSGNQANHKDDRGKDVNLKVFKHKGVDTLIRNRILALESSVVTKTIERPPLKEVDRTITEVKKTENTDELIQQLKEEPEEQQVLPQPNVPSSNIRQIAQQMQKERPEVDIKIKPLPAEKPAQEQKVPAKPTLKKQYSFTMDTKFHEETGKEGWQKVQDIAASSTEDEESELESVIDHNSVSQSILNVKESSEESTQESDTTESPPSPPPPPAIKKKTNEKKKKNGTVQKSHATLTNKNGNREEETNFLAPETVRKILEYGAGDLNEGRETVVNYYRRELEDFSEPERRFSDSDTASQYSEYDKMRSYDPNYRARSPAYDQYESDYGYNTASYYPDDRSFLGTDDDRDYREAYYYSDDDRTLVDEDEIRNNVFEDDYDPRGYKEGYDRRYFDDEPLDAREKPYDSGLNYEEYGGRDDFNRLGDYEETAHEGKRYSEYDSGYSNDYPYENSPHIANQPRFNEFAVEDSGDYHPKDDHVTSMPVQGYFDRDLY